MGRKMAIRWQIRKIKCQRILKLKARKVTIRSHVRIIKLLT